MVPPEIVVAVGDEITVDWPAGTLAVGDEITVDWSAGMLAATQRFRALAP